MKKVLTSLATYWKIFAKAIGWFNSRVILTIVYIVGIGAYKGVTLFASLLSKNTEASAGNWKEKEYDEPTVQNLSRQF